MRRGYLLKNQITLLVGVSCRTARDTKHGARFRFDSRFGGDSCPFMGKPPPTLEPSRKMHGRDPQSQDAETHRHLLIYVGSMATFSSAPDAETHLHLLIARDSFLGAPTFAPSAAGEIDPLRPASLKLSIRRSFCPGMGEGYRGDRGRKPAINRREVNAVKLFDHFKVTG